MGTLNLRLRLKYITDVVKSLILKHGIDILCMQESEIEAGFMIDFLKFPGYEYEEESNCQKAGLGRDSPSSPITVFFVCFYVSGTL